MEVAEAQVSKIDDLRAALSAASSALKSYQYGNASPDLAEGIAEQIDALVSKATEPAA